MKSDVYVGQFFGRWIVRAMPYTENGELLCSCECVCGTKRYVRVRSLISGASKSCGCLKAELVREAQTTHGMTESIEYRRWISLKTRAGGPGYEHVTVDPSWVHSFAQFYADVGPIPSEEYSLDRIDGTRGYVPGNCRWATIQEQNNNTARNVLITDGAVTMTLAQWSKETGIPYGTLGTRIFSLGWDIHRALVTPVKHSRWSTKQ